MGSIFGERLHHYLCLCVYLAGIFPWGRAKQKGPDGEKVVSTRAIKHLRELTRIQKGELLEEKGRPLHKSPKKKKTLVPRLHTSASVAGAGAEGPGRVRGEKGPKVQGSKNGKTGGKGKGKEGGKVVEEGKEKLNACVLFILTREDALQFRANDEACPSFARYTI